MLTDMRLKIYLLIVTLCTFSITLASQDCDTLNNRITFSNMDTVYTTCAGDAIPDLLSIVVDTPTMGDTSVLVVVDTGGVIILVSESGPVDLDTLGSGLCFIYLLSANDSLDTITTGWPLDSVGGCYSLSNSLQVNRISSEVNGGDLTTDSETTICADNGTPDSLFLIIEDNTGDAFAWLLTDTMGNILVIPSTAAIPLDDLETGYYQAWNISYASGLVGLMEGNNVSQLQGCYSLSNAIDFQISKPLGGIISSMNDSDMIYICESDSIISDTIEVGLEGNSGDSSKWIVTTTDSLILELMDDVPISISGRDTQFILWHISYNDSIFGLDIGDALSKITGCFGLSNPLSVFIDQPVVSGVITTVDSTEFVESCVGEGQSSSLELLLQPGSGRESRWLITDSSNVIWDIQDSLPLTISDTGEIFVWNLSYHIPPAGLEIGNSANDLQGCFGLSNFILIMRQALQGGQITTRDTMTEITFCPGDSSQSLIEVELDRGDGENGSWIITDAAGKILEIPLSPPFDFSGFDQGNYQIWYVNYNDSLGNFAVDSHLDSLGGCYAFSNPLQIQIGGVDGGRIFLPDSATSTRICVDDGLEEFKFPSVAGATGNESRWLILNQEGYILQIAESPPFSFEEINADTCYVQHVSYDNELNGLDQGIHTTSLQGCFGLSNLIAIIKSQVEAGTILTTDTAMTAIICPVEGSTHVDVVVEKGSGENTTWIITDTAGTIRDLPFGPPFDFSAYGMGTSLIWHMTSTGEIERMEVGKNLDDLRGCRALSDPIQVNHSGGSVGGMLSTLDGKDEIVICVESNFSDLVDVDLRSASGENMAWIITNEDGEIIQLPEQPPFVFASEDPTDRYIWNLSYKDGVTGLQLGEFVDDLVGCYDMSNPIKVIKKVNACGVEKLVEFGTIHQVGSDWTLVNLENEYESMVVVATPQIDGTSKPMVTRVRNAQGNSFEVRVQNPSGSNLPAQFTVRYVVAEEGVYQPEIDGIKMEAHRWESVRTSKKRQDLLEPRDYVHLYHRPVVIGQVMTYNDDRWSVFWASDGRRKLFTPRPYSLNTSKHIGEDIASNREDETLGVIIIEAGSYELNGVWWDVNTTPKAIRGVDDTHTGFQHETRLDSITGGVLSMHGMRGSNYGWPVFFGEHPFENKYMTLAIDEDQISDQERRHPQEQVAYILFGPKRARFHQQDQTEVSAPPHDVLSTSDQAVESTLSISPNPATNYLRIQIDVPESGRADLHVLDLQGKKLFERNLILNAGHNQLIWSDLDLTNGLYALTLVTSNGTRMQKKFVILR